MHPLVQKLHGEKVWIGTQEFVFRVAPAEDERLCDDEGDAAFDGDTDFDKLVVTLCQELALSVFLETVYHELTHVVNFVARIDEESIEKELAEKHDKVGEIDDADDVVDEMIADSHGKVWSQFWINNPRFARWHLSACVAIRKERQYGAKEKK